MHRVFVFNQPGSILRVPEILTLQYRNNLLTSGPYRNELVWQVSIKPGITCSIPQRFVKITYVISSQDEPPLGTAFSDNDQLLFSFPNDEMKNKSSSYVR